MAKKKLMRVGSIVWPSPEFALELHHAGMTQEQIAHELGIKQSTVSRWLRQAKKAAA